MRAIVVALAALAAASPPGTARAQAPAPAPAATVPSVYIQEAVLGTVARAQPNQRVARSCTVTALMRLYCGTATSCDIASASPPGQPSFFVSRMRDIAQICDLPLSQATELRVTYRCRYGGSVDGTVIQESRSIALEDSGNPLGRSAFRILMACH